jgi:hypothetical protein
MSGQFTAKKSPADPRGDGYGMLAVCSHADCAGRSWPDRAALVDGHGHPGDSHAWGWWHEGKLYAPLETAMTDPPYAVKETRRPCSIPNITFDIYREQIEKEMQRAILGPLANAPADDRSALPWSARRAIENMAIVTGRSTSEIEAAARSVAERAKPGATVGHRTAAILGLPLEFPAAARDERRAKEAPLVALVANVPEGLDANGWRAAVLGFTDHPAPVNAFEKVPRLANALREFVTVLAVARAPMADVAEAIVDTQPDDDMRTGRVLQALHAYARAIAPPGSRPAPFCRKPPGLPLDMGEG